MSSTVSLSTIQSGSRPPLYDTSSPCAIVSANAFWSSSDMSVVLARDSKWSWQLYQDSSWGSLHLWDSTSSLGTMDGWVPSRGHGLAQTCVDPFVNCSVHCRFSKYGAFHPIVVSCCGLSPLVVAHVWPSWLCLSLSVAAHTYTSSHRIEDRQSWCVIS